MILFATYRDVFYCYCYQIFYQPRSIKDQMIVLLMLLAVAHSQYPWVKPDELNTGLPHTISIYTLNTTSSPYNTSLTGGYAKFNMHDHRLEFIVRDANRDALGYFPKTLMQYAEEEQNVVYAVINGGYFNMTSEISSSFIAENFTVKSKSTVNEYVNIHPTVGAFGLTADGNFQAQYIYSFDPGMQTFCFEKPNPIPGPVVSRTEGRHWNVKEGIGAGPILIKNWTVIDGNPEHFGESSMVEQRHPRSAICIDAHNNLFLVVIDGRYEGSEGMMVAELAELMHSLGCKEAMNLDGGGSTMLYANNRTINRPSDPAGPRAVISAIIIRDRFKKKYNLASQ